MLLNITTVCNLTEYTASSAGVVYRVNGHLVMICENPRLVAVVEEDETGFYFGRSLETNERVGYARSFTMLEDLFNNEECDTIRALN